MNYSYIRGVMRDISKLFQMHYVFQLLKKLYLKPCH